MAFRIDMDSSDEESTRITTIPWGNVAFDTFLVIAVTLKPPRRRTLVQLI